MGFLSRLRSATPATDTVVRFRGTAEQMRIEEPELYSRLVADAGAAAKDLVRTDPDAYVAIYLASLAEDGHPWIPPKERALRVSFRVTAWRPSAEHLREHDAEFYDLLLSQADGTHEADAARGDPDGFVALELSKQADTYAQRLKAEHPDRYAAMLATAQGSEAEELARLDPDAYVGVCIAEEEEQGI